MKNFLVPKSYYRSNNKLSNNNIGVYSQNSNSTAINSNIVCGNAILDFNFSDWLSSYGNSNICDNPDGWNDTGITGCTYSCYNPFFIKRFSAQYNSHNSLLTITVTFKTNSGNYGGNDALVDLKLTDSSNNVIKTWKNVATARGKVNFKENIIALPIGTYAVTVTDVNLLGYTFDDTGNSDSFTVK